MVTLTKEAGIPSWGGRLVIQLQGILTGVTASVATLGGAGTKLAASNSYANDAAAAAGGVAVGQYYRNGSVVQIRVS